MNWKLTYLTLKLGKVSDLNPEHVNISIKKKRTYIAVLEFKTKWYRGARLSIK